MKQKKKKVKAKPFLKSKEWAQLRLEALERDQHKCCLCGCEEKLVVHHVLYRRGHKELQADLDNLVCLCVACHWKVHRGTGNLKLSVVLQTSRQQQWQYVLQHLK